MTLHLTSSNLTRVVPAQEQWDGDRKGSGASDSSNGRCHGWVGDVGGDNRAAVYHFWIRASTQVEREAFMKSIFTVR